LVPQHRYKSRKPKKASSESGAAVSSALPLHREILIQPPIVFAVKLPGSPEVGRALLKIDTMAFGLVGAKRDHGINAPCPRRMVAREGLEPDRSDIDLLIVNFQEDAVAVTSLGVGNLAKIEIHRSMIPPI
jgi:hypothetical protein